MEQPEYWQTLFHLSYEKVDKQLLEKLISIYNEDDYWRITPSEAMHLPLETVIAFYHHLLKEGYSTQSVVRNQANSNWMQTTDFCFLNIRALGTGDGDSATGTFLDALKVLPTLRAQSIHLAPFFDCVFDNIYALEDLYIFNEDLIHTGMQEAGIKASHQLKALVDGIHLLDKTVGFDLEPHTGQFSRVVVSFPAYFRWIALDSEKKRLRDNMTMEEILTQAAQGWIVQKVEEIRTKHLSESGLQSLQDVSSGADTVRECHGNIVKDLIDQGFWTIPCHTWSGAGVPRYKSYHETDNYPIFEYLSVDGTDQSGEAFGLLTPYRFNAPLPVNQIPSKDEAPQPQEEVWNFFQNIFTRMREFYHFDFIRLDYADHVFDSVSEEDPNLVIADRMTPALIKEALAYNREDTPYVGAMAERLGDNIAPYAELGFDLILGSDSLMDITPHYLRYHFEKHQKLVQLNEGKTHKMGILFAVDTHDTGHPYFWKETPAERFGAKGMGLRHFLSRFGSPGEGYRPKYECIGNQDLSYGLYPANNERKHLIWKNDQEYNRRYHYLEDIYALNRNMLTNGLLQHYIVEQDYAYWFIDHEPSQQRLLAIIRFEHDIKDSQQIIRDGETLQIPERFSQPMDGLTIPLGEQFSLPPKITIVHYDFQNRQDSSWSVSEEEGFHLETGNLEPSATRLYRIKPA
jgi:hypothetical protein